VLTALNKAADVDCGFSKRRILVVWVMALFYGKQIDDKPTVWQNAEFLNAAAGGKYRNHWDLKW
jgi:hypothetical protein